MPFGSEGVEEGVGLALSGGGFRATLFHVGALWRLNELGWHAFFERLRRRKPYNVAITAVARKLVVLVWHMLTRGEDYRYTPPALTRRKLDALHKLTTGHSAPRPPGSAIPKPADDRRIGVDAERQYQAFLRDRFGPQGPPEARTAHSQSSRKRSSAKKKP